MQPSPTATGHQQCSSATSAIRSNPVSRCCASRDMRTATRRVLRGIAFDMDGTLTVPCIDFAMMRRRVGAATGDILEEIAKMAPDAQARSRAAIWDIEQQALANMQLMPGVPELCAYLDQKRIPRGLITRNVKASVDWLHENHLAPLHSLTAFSPALGRECGTEFKPPLRYKPYPDSLLHVCKTWGIQPSEALFVGDSARDDVVCGNRAGTWTVLLDQQGRYQKDEQLQGEMAPTFIISAMSELIPLLETHFDLQPPVHAKTVVMQEATAP